MKKSINEILDTMPPNNEKPYIEEIITSVKYKYNPEYGDDRVCTCGHVYYRHFDTYEQMDPIGCKYCGCNHFTEDADTRLRHLSPEGRNNVLIGDYVGLVIRYVNTYAQDGNDVDMEIDCPDFLDHDTQLMYLYEEDQPCEAFKFDSDWNWLMPVIEMIETKLSGYDATSNGGWGILVEEWVRINKSFDEYKAFKNNDIGIVYRGVVRYIKKWNSISSGKLEIDDLPF